MRRLAVAVTDRTNAKDAVLAFRRQELERWIEYAIALLDAIDGDSDREDDEREPDIDELCGDEAEQDRRKNAPSENFRSPSNVQGSETAVRSWGEDHAAI
jgi:hypothetical protein